MNNYCMFFYAIAAISAAFAAGNGYAALLQRSRTAIVEGIICSLSLISPKKFSLHTGKWAKVSYKVNGKKYITSAPIPVPADAQIETKITVRYDTAYPGRLYHFAWGKIAIASAVAVLSLCLGISGLI